MAVQTIWEQAEIEALRPLQRPKVRCTYPAVYLYEDGRKEYADVRANAEIVVDGNNPWLVLRCVGGTSREYRVSWGLLLEVLNDPYASPVDFLGVKPVEYER